MDVAPFFVSLWPVKSSYSWSESIWPRIIVGFDPDRPIQSVREESFSDVRHTVTERGVLSKRHRKLLGRRRNVTETSITHLLSYAVISLMTNLQQSNLMIITAVNKFTGVVK